MHASMTLDVDGRIYFNSDLSQASGLSHFGLETPTLTDTGDGNGTDHSWGYNWLATPFNYDGTLLDVEGTQTLTYNTSAYSEIAAPCLTIDGVTGCIIGYAGFGDPIGRGGVSAESLGLGGVTPFNHGGGPDSCDDPTGRTVDFICGVNFTSFTIADPTISGGTLYVGGAVPEPATWLSMILGFGLLGGAMRRRRVLAHV